MNYLAHMYLSFDDPEIMIGNYIADALKGNKINRYREGIRKGIILHREIDRFTDQHPVVMKSKVRLYPQYHKYSGVIIDMYYDHFLAVNWSKYSDEDLSSFTSRNYKTLMQHYFLLPPRSKRMLPFMMQSDWLSAYASMQGMQLSFRGLSRRTRFISNMENATNELTAYYDLFRDEFTQFFPELYEHVDNMIVEIRKSA